MSPRAHVASVRSLVLTWGALMTLTALTVALADVPFGRFDVAVALGIASVKAALVGLSFMHLRHEGGMHALALLLALFFVFAFVSITLLDHAEYRPDVEERVEDLRYR
ncbi:MAG: cytochrome C oxidase subunit IV family protein [Planctomycetota bacterium]